MKLLRLILQGFKSFADKTTIEFAEGMTVIVGPNGCGKSNISDAVRWVLGEQNIRNLRGQKTEDIIFSGSEERAPKNAAEVCTECAKMKASESSKKQQKIWSGSVI